MEYPWKVITYEGHTPPEGGDWVGNIQSEAGERIYHGAFSTHAIRKKSYAILMAAAPDMLEALEQVVYNWEYQKKTGGKYFTSAPTEYEWKQKVDKETHAIVDKAIAKAKGSD